MRKFNKPDIAVLVRVTIFTILFVAFFFWFETLHFSGSATDASIASSFTFLFCYFILFAASAGMSITNFRSRKEVTEKWIMWFGILPICLTVGTPIVCAIADDFISTYNDRPHLLSCEVKSSRRLDDGRMDLATSSGLSGGILPEPRQDAGTYYYDFSSIINTQPQEDRTLEIESDNCTATFHFDIPYRPVPMPTTDWKKPSSFKCDPPGSMTLEIRYRVEKYDRRY